MLGSGLVLAERLGGIGLSGEHGQQRGKCTRTRTRTKHTHQTHAPNPHPDCCPPSVLLESLLESLDEVLGAGALKKRRLGDIAGMGSRTRTRTRTHRHPFLPTLHALSGHHTVTA